MKNLKRNLRYWMRNMWIQALTMIIVLLVMVVLMSYLEGENILEVFWSRFATYMVLIMFIFTFANSFSSVSIYFPLTISFGSDRKTSFAAMQISQHLMTLVLLGIGIFSMSYAWFAGEKEVMAVVVTIALAVMFFLQGLGAGISTITLKFGRNAGMAVYIIGVVVTMLTIGIATGYAVVRGDTVEFQPEDILQWIKIWLPIVAVLFDAGMVTVLYRYMRKCDLQFA